MKKKISKLFLVTSLICGLLFSLATFNEVEAQQPRNERPINQTIETPWGDINYKCCRSGSTTCDNAGCGDIPPIIIQVPKEIIQN